LRSRRHAELRHEGERWFPRGLGSSNGTRVNGMRVIEDMQVPPPATGSAWTAPRTGCCRRLNAR